MVYWKNSKGLVGLSWWAKGILLKGEKVRERESDHVRLCGIW